MAQWARVCGVHQAPAEGQVAELEVSGTAICLANVNGELSALGNLCPHRQGPLGQGWIEGNAVICPWHSWAFNRETGLSEYPENHRVPVYPVKVEDGSVWAALDDANVDEALPKS